MIEAGKETAAIYDGVQAALDNGGDVQAVLESQRVVMLRKVAGELSIRDSEWRSMGANKADLVREILSALAPDTPYQAPAEKPATEAAPQRSAQSNHASTGDLAKILADAVSAHMSVPTAQLDEERVKEMIEGTLEERLESATAMVVEQVGKLMVQFSEDVHAQLEGKGGGSITIQVPGKPDIQLDGHQHENFAVLVSLLAAEVHVMMVGPAGSGKTHGGENAAKALGLPFYCISVGSQTTMSQLFGYMNATGDYVGTVFRKAYELGGVFLLDEIDAGNPNVLTALNAALANNVCAFPDGMISRHPDFRCIAAANTYGNGQDRQYVGRNQLDATSLDRFATLNWDYDNEMEKKITGLTGWVDIVQAYRKAAQELGVRHIISPRASLNGAKLLLQGAIPIKQVVDLVVWKSLDRANVSQITNKSGVSADQLKAAAKEAAEIAKSAKPKPAPNEVKVSAFDSFAADVA